MSLRDAWLLDRHIAFLNHGSFGACPRAILDAQAAFRDRMEAEPVRFLTRELEPLLDDARAALARFVGAQPADIVFVPNATTAINAVLRSLVLMRGDQVVITNHAYAACRNALLFVAERAGAVVVTVDLPFPAPGEAAITEAVLAAVTSRTRLVLLDQVTSPTALVLPIRTLVQRIESRGVPVLVDAAHAPGLVSMAVDRIGASFTAGNLHKWLCAPKGAGFLHVRADRQYEIRPTIISHGASSPRVDRSRFQLEFGWTGTADPTPYLCVPCALEFMGSLVSGGWPALMQANRDAARQAARQIAAIVPQPAEPVVDCAMASLVLQGPAEEARALQDRLFFEHRIEVPVIPFGGRRLLRLSMQRYVSERDVERLGEALAGLFGGHRRRKSSAVTRTDNVV